MPTSHPAFRNLNRLNQDELGPTALFVRQLKYRLQFSIGSFLEYLVQYAPKRLASVNEHQRPTYNSRSDILCGIRVFSESFSCWYGNGTISLTTIMWLLDSFVNFKRPIEKENDFI